MCGGTSWPAISASVMGGLSPRVRGNLRIVWIRNATSGSIPACAGEPETAFRSDSVPKVYPRVCGGTALALVHHDDEAGLSPRVRGNLIDLGPACAGERSIPACAGEPRGSSDPMASRRVYPRVCGGTYITYLRYNLRSGLSPRVRGNPTQYGIPGEEMRSIPACAGEPGAIPRAPAGYRVYPRVCGGTTPQDPHRRPGRGLSPRVRGNPIRPRRRPAGNRSIPACAGEPRRDGYYGGSIRVYPRVCGGTRWTACYRKSWPGLSPRVRGNRRNTKYWLCAARSIPACAGEPLDFPNCQRHS